MQRTSVRKPPRWSGSRRPGACWRWLGHDWRQCCVGLGWIGESQGSIYISVFLAEDASHLASTGLMMHVVICRKHGLGVFLYSMRNLKGLIMPDPQCGSVVFASDLLAFKIFQFSHLFKLQRKRINKAMASSSHGWLLFFQLLGPVHWKLALQEMTVRFCCICNSSLTQRWWQKQLPVHMAWQSN